MGNVLEVNDATFKKEVLEAAGTVLVDFWAPWCGPCRMQAPILDKLATSGAVNAKITKVNTDESPATAGNYSIQSIPTIIVFKDGKEVVRKVGVQSEDALKVYLK
ncbi:MAG: thioredoxin [Spirochaetes bacterium]|jgi:thioredoxin 1|nr:thioredoxin [Spirochaetota bacterium]